MQSLRKKFAFILLFFALQGYAEELILESTPVIEAKGGYFIFASSKMRDVYEHGGWDIQLSSSIPVWQPCESWCVHAYGSIEFLRCSGRSTLEKYRTHVWMLPVNVGLRPVFLLSEQVQYYFTIGPRYFYIHQHNNSPYVDKNKSKNGFGGFANTGFKIILDCNFAIDIFSEYSYARIRFHSSKANTQDVQVGGFTFGGGLSYLF